ncbi:hypothetical protein Tco_1434939 [Tanacetum coccineum]
MDTTKAQQIALDDALVTLANRLKIGKCNHRLSSTLKSNEPTLQVAIVSIHHNSLRFKMNNKSHTLNLKNFRDMLKIFPKLLSQKFEDPPFEEEILPFIRDLGHTREIKIYGTILPDDLTNQEMLDSKAYKEYYVVASGAEPPKPKTKYKKKADEPVTPSKSKTAPASKGSRLKSPAKVDKTAKKKQPAMMPKTKGLAVLSEVVLTKAEQIKLATKRSKTQFHSSHASGSGDGVDTQSKVPDTQQQSHDEEDVDEEIDVNDDSDETKFDR